MRFNVDYREDKTGALKGSKHYFLIGHVEFTEEEKAIIQQRGLYDHGVVIPGGMPPPTTTGNIAEVATRFIGIVLTPLGLLTYCTAKVTLGQGGTQGGVNTGVIMVVIGIGLFIASKFLKKDFNDRLQLEQTLTPRKLLSNPEFKVYGSNMQTAKGWEILVREKLSELATFIRDSSSVPEKTSYDL